MDKVWATFRTVGVLLGLWVILAVVGIVTGVVPLEGLRAAPRDRATPSERDAGVAASDTDAGSAAAASDEASDAGAASAAIVEPDPDPDTDAQVAAAPLRPPAVRWTVCASSSAEPSLSIGQVFGDERPEIVVGCADGWHVIGLDVHGPARVAVFSAPSPGRSGPQAPQRRRLGPAAVGDVDGDGLADLVLPLAYETDAGASRGGNLYWVPSSRYGGIRDPMALAPIAAVAAAIAPLDASAGADVVAMNRANPLAQLPSEAWVFGGGAAPTRLGALQTGLDGRTIRIGDLDRDGREDVVALARGRVDLHFGDGAGAFPRRHTFELADVREIGLGDLDGDGGADLAVLGDGLRWIRAGALSGMEPRGIDGVPATLRGLEIADVDGDGKLDFTGWDHPRLAILRHRDEVDFATETAFTLAGPFGPRRHRVLDLDLDGAIDDVVMLGTTATEQAPLELLLLVDALGGAEITPGDEPRDVPDAPLMVRAALPE